MKQQDGDSSETFDDMDTYMVKTKLIQCKETVATRTLLVDNSILNRLHS